MIYRYFRVISTGQWCLDLFTDTGMAFGPTTESHRADIAAGLGLDADDLEAVDSADPDLRTGDLLAMSFTARSVLNWSGATTDEKLDALGRQAGMTT